MNNIRMTRREVLSRSAAALAAGTLAPYVWTSSQAKAQSANDRPVMASIGVGGQGTGIGRRAARFADVAACCDVDRKHAERFAGFFEGKLICEAVKLYKGRKPGDHMRNLFESIKDRTQPISDVFTHHRTMTACHLSNLAILLKRKLRWDAAAEDFIGDDQASLLRSRRQREPYTI